MPNCDHISCNFNQLQSCAKGSPSQGTAAQSQSFNGQSGTPAASIFSYPPSSTTPLPSAAPSSYANNVFAANNSFGQPAGAMTPNVMSYQQGQGAQAPQPGYQVQGAQVQPQYTPLNPTAGPMTQNVTSLMQNQDTSNQSLALQALAAALMQPTTNPYGQSSGGWTSTVNQSAPPQGYSGMQPLQPLQAAPPQGYSGMQSLQPLQPAPTQPQPTFTLGEIQQLLQNQARLVAPPPPPQQNLVGDLLTPETNVSRSNAPAPAPVQSVPPPGASDHQSEFKGLMKEFKNEISHIKSDFERQKAKDDDAARVREEALRSQMAARDAASQSREEALAKEVEALKLKQKEHEMQVSSQTFPAESSRRKLESPNRNPFGFPKKKLNRPIAGFGGFDAKSVFDEWAEEPPQPYEDAFGMLHSSPPRAHDYGDHWELDHPDPRARLTEEETKESFKPTFGQREDVQPALPLQLKKKKPTSVQTEGVQMPHMQLSAPVNPFAPRQSTPVKSTTAPAPAPTGPAAPAPANLLEGFNFPELKAAEQPDLTTRPPTQFPWTQVGRAGRPLNAGRPGPSAPGEPYIKDVCTKDEPYHWPQDFQPMGTRRLGNTRVKEFPNAKCRLCPQKKDKADKSHCHPLILHEHRYQLLETWMEKTRPGSVCGVPKCPNKNGHATEDHGLGEWRDNPFNVKLSDELTAKYAQFWRPWPANTNRIPFPPYYYFPGNGNARPANEYPALRQELSKGLDWGLLDLAKGIIYSLQWVEAMHLNLTSPQYDRVIHPRFRFWPEDLEKAAERRSVAGDRPGNAHGSGQRAAGGQGAQRPQGSQRPYGNRGGQRPQGTQLDPPKDPLNDGFAGVAHHPDLPNPQYYKNSLSYPHFDFMKAIRPMFMATDQTDLGILRAEWEANYKAAQECQNEMMNAHVYDTLAKVWKVVSMYIPHWNPKVNAVPFQWRADSLLAKKMEDRRAARRARNFAQPVVTPASNDGKESKEKKATDTDLNLTRRTSDRMQSCGFHKWSPETNPVGKWDEVDGDDLNPEDRLHPEVMPETNPQARTQWDQYVLFQKPLLAAKRVEIIFESVAERVDAAAIPLVSSSAQMLGRDIHKEKLGNLASLFKEYRGHVDGLCNGILETIDSVNPGDVFTVQTFQDLAKKIKQAIETFENKVKLTIERIFAEKMLGSIVAVGLKDGRDESLKEFLLGSFLPAASIPPAQIPRVVFPQSYEEHYQEVIARQNAPPREYDETFTERKPETMAPGQSAPAAGPS